MNFRSPTAAPPLLSLTARISLDSSPVLLDRTVGSEIKKTRPYLVLSPDKMSRHIATVIVAPMTTAGRLYPSRVPCRF